MLFKRFGAVDHATCTDVAIDAIILRHNVCVVDVVFSAAVEEKVPMRVNQKDGPLEETRYSEHARGELGVYHVRKCPSMRPLAFYALTPCDLDQEAFVDRNRGHYQII